MSRRALVQFAGRAGTPILSIWGQSNAEGSVTSLVNLPVGWGSAQPQIQVANYGNTENAHGAFNWRVMQPAVNSGRVYTPSLPSAWGVEQSLSHDLLNRYGSVYIDKLAYGGMGIDAWRPSGYWYDELTTIAADEKASFSAAGLIPIWLPVVWIQGEANISDTTAVYQAKLEALIDDERSRSIAGRPWIFQLLGPQQYSFDLATRNRVNDAFRNVAGGTRANCYYLDPALLSLTMNTGNAPQVHYSDLAYLTLGHAHFDLMVTNGLLP